MLKQSLSKLLVLVLLALLYFAAGRLGLMLAFVNPSATAVWPPTGIALAALLVFGYRLWPAILVGAFLVNITTSSSVPASLMIAVGNTLEALVGAYLINRYAHGRRVFERAQDIFRFIVLAGVVGTTVSATIGVTSLVLNGLATLPSAPYVWLTWWLGDATGALIVAPVLILWANFVHDRNRAQVLEAALLLVSLVVVGLTVFSDLSPLGIRYYPVYFLVLPIVAWFAFRMGPPETATAILVLYGIAISGTIMGSGPFARYAANEALLLLQGYMSVVAMTFLSLAAVIAERRRTEQALALSEHKYKAVVETAHDAVITINERREILYINAAAEHIFGYAVADMIGRDLTMLIPEYVRHAPKASLARVVETGQKHVSWGSMELRGRHKDGSEIPLEVSFGEYRQQGERLFTGVVRDISERQRAEESKRFLATLVESSGDAVIGKTLDGVVLSWNKGAEKLYGYTAAEMIGRPISIIIPPDRPDELPQILERIQSGEQLERFETERIRKDGERVHISLTISPIRDATGAIRGASTVARDITEQKRADETLRRNQSFLAQAQAIGGIGSWVSSLGTDKSLWWSRESYQIFGLAEGTPVDNDLFFSMVHPDDRAPIQQAVQQAIASHRPYAIDHRIRSADGSERWVSERADVVFDTAGRPVRLVGVIQDITDRKHIEAKVQRLAYRDPVTNLPNRTLLFARMATAIETAQANAEPLAIVLININEFRDINDTLGHRNGDRVLNQIAERLQLILFKKDTVARPAADEFVVLLPRLAKPEDINLVVRKIAEVLAPVIFVADIPLDVRTTIGVALYPEHGRDADTLYQHADVALNVAKERRQAHVVYETALDRYDPQRLSLMGELRAAIVADELRLYYQPRISLRTQKIVGVEALVRWQHPKRGLIAPDNFIPAAEKTSLIDDLTQWVLRTALFQARQWQENGLTLEISVNVSARNLRDGFLTYPVKELLEKTAIAPERLILEVTESVIMFDPAAAIRELEAVRTLGVQIAIDDFGIGYSSLAYLRQLPVTHLKIDKSFVINMQDPNNAAIVRGTVKLAHSLGLSVTAEGVEDKTTYKGLKLLGCDQAQGYYISKPLPPDAFLAWLLDSPWQQGKAARRAED
jgi:diguanylate cyclase (GGDEF)-like protein/PAS domain S-box-containing protein